VVVAVVVSAVAVLVVTKRQVHFRLLLELLTP
jgi:hypothetical protein